MNFNPNNNIISVKTLGNTKCWIKIRRNNQYITNNITNPDPIYYWSVTDHNLFDPRDHSLQLYFIEPDATQIENIDRNNHMALDINGRYRLLHTHLKYKGIKITPTYFIARSTKQIDDALRFVKYCIVKSDKILY